MKLIYSGKVLKDTDTVAGCNVKPNDFFVVMITKVSLKKKIQKFSLFQMCISHNDG